MPFFYRFRSLDALLGEHQELEKQEIYFSPPEQLNDPMEGYKDLVWQGDEIVWRNLIKHYLLCLTQTVLTAMISGEEYQPVISKNFIFTTQHSLPTQSLKAIYQRICEIFFSSYNLNELPELLANCKHPFRRDEIEFCLRGLHPVAFNNVMKIFREESLIPPAGESPPPPELTEENVVNSLFKVLNTIKDKDRRIDPEALRHLFIAAGHIHKQCVLTRYLGETNQLAKAWHSIFYSFPEQYVDNLSNLVYFDWYTACFVADPTHAAMWGNYGVSHKGVCLKFRAEETDGNLSVLKVRGIVGWHGGPNGGGPNYGEIPLPFEKVTYSEKMAEIDFFRSIGRLPIPALKSGWYTDDTGQVSECAEAVLSQTQDWHQSYWASFRAITLTKLQDWQFENEYRLRLTSALDSFREANDRKLTYRFSDLEGIIFGIRTPLEDKVRIFNIIATKCKEHGRESFEFSQAAYSGHSGKIEIRRLDLLRFNGL
ncbi:MAG: DUF2971 domain-containing protein [Leptospirillum sp.]|jgi:hypothetical protein